YVSFKVLGVPLAQLLVLLFIFARLMPRCVMIYRRAYALATDACVFDTVGDLERECLEAAEPPATGRRDVVFARSIRFECVSFTYLQRDAVPALHELDLEIPAGSTTAIVGPSGAGKTTVADLLIGLLSPTTGRILIDDEPLSADGLV